ncbi:MAG TPA: Dabb family protein [Trebonia sp.]|nr:Dabb family protein [Trebonia sp.]
MIRHVVLVKWKPEATAEQKQFVATELAALPTLVTSIIGFALGPDAGINEGNADFAITADFEDEAGYLEYRDHPDHREIVTKHFGPLVANRTAIQFRL